MREREEDWASEYEEALTLITEALDECCARWERGEAASPDARDLVYEGSRAIGIGTHHADISDVLVDDFYAFQEEGHDTRELGDWLAMRLLGGPA